MRFPLLALLLLLLPIGCGSVRLGEEGPLDSTNFDAASGLDAGELQVVVTVSLPDAGCAPCVELTATGAQGTPPYTFVWDDGSTDAHRSVCAPVSQDQFTVTSRDALGRSSAPHPLRVDVGDKFCPPTPKLCLSNGSFEGKPAYNSGTPVAFDAPPWSDCAQPSRINLPDVVSATIPQIVVAVPAPTEGETYLGLREGMQASQALCAPLRAGDQRSIRFDARKLDISNVTLNNTEAVFLQLSGGINANCSLNEVLWVSPKLVNAWTSFCVTLAPSQYMDQLTLLSITDGSSIAVSDLAVDNLVSVASCP